MLPYSVASIDINNILKFIFNIFEHNVPGSIAMVAVILMFLSICAMGYFATNLINDRKDSISAISSMTGMIKSLSDDSDDMGSEINNAVNRLNDHLSSMHSGSMLLSQKLDQTMHELDDIRARIGRLERTFIVLISKIGNSNINDVLSEFNYIIGGNEDGEKDN